MSTSERLTELKYGPYSHSRIQCYHDCPRKFKFTYVDGIRVRVERSYFEKGSFFHYLLEHFPNIPPKPFKFKFPENIAKKDEYVDLAKSILVEGGRVHDLVTKHVLFREYPFSLTLDFKPTKKKKGSLTAGVIDYVGQEKDGELLIVDWKTGKSRGVGHDQVAMYALWAFAACPNIDRVNCTYYYLEGPEERQIIFERDADFERLKEETINRIARIEADTSFDRKVTRACEQCEHYAICEPFKVNLTKRA